MKRRLILLVTITSLAGAATAWVITSDAIGGGYQLAPFYAAVSAGIAVGALWYWLVERRQRFTTVRGTVAGALTGLLSHPLFWYLFLLDHWLRYQLLGQPLSSLGEPPINPAEGLAAAAVYSLWSWFLVGWITLAVGGVVGGITGYLLSWSNRDRGNQTG